jgi:hypothetical protein
MSESPDWKIVVRKLVGDYEVTGHFRTMRLHKKIMHAIEKCTYNKPDPTDPPGLWSTWIDNDGVYGEQMQACFCVECGEYIFLPYQLTGWKYYPAPSEPLPCQCGRDDSL